MKLLIVDDEIMIKRSLKKLISESPLPFELCGEAEDGQEALTLWRQHRPHLIITDITMPVMDGLELIETIQAEDSHVKFIIISGYNDFEYARQALKFGVEDYLLKPIQVDQFLTLLQSVYHKIERSNTNYAQIGYQLLEIQTNATALVKEVWMMNEQSAIDIIIEYNNLLTKQSLPLDKHIERMEEIFMLVEAELMKRSKGKIMESVKKKWMPTDEDALYEMIHENTVCLIREVKKIRSLGQLKQINEGLAYIQLHFADEKLALSQVAKKVGLSDSYFSKCFKEDTGLSFSDYVIQLRMEEAKKLIETTEKKTYEVALSVGYSDYPHFSKYFKKYFGISPIEYKKKL